MRALARALALVLVLLAACCGGEPEPYQAPQAYSVEVCRLHCLTFCTKLVGCWVDAGKLEAYRVPLAEIDCSAGCEVGLTTVIYDRQLDKQGLFEYCDDQRKTTPKLTCEQLTSYGVES